MGGLILAAKISLAGPILAAKMVQGTSFSAKIGPAGPILGGTNFDVTGPAMAWCQAHGPFIIHKTNIPL